MVEQLPSWGRHRQRKLCGDTERGVCEREEQRESERERKGGMVEHLPKTWPAWFRIQGSRFRVHGSGFRVRGSEFRVQGSGFRTTPRVWGFKF